MIGFEKKDGFKITYSDINRRFYVYYTYPGRPNILIGSKKTKPTIRELFLMAVKNKVFEV